MIYVNWSVRCHARYGGDVCPLRYTINASPRTAQNWATCYESAFSREVQLHVLVANIDALRLTAYRLARPVSLCRCRGNVLTTTLHLYLDNLLPRASLKSQSPTILFFNYAFAITSANNFDLNYKIKIYQLSN